jgi:hypothetical protein
MMLGTSGQGDVSGQRLTNSRQHCGWVNRFVEQLKIVALTAGIIQ